MPQKILGSELPDNALELLNKGTTTIVATVDEDGYPRTAPIGLVGAPDRKTLRLGIASIWETYKNIKRNGKVMVCVIDEGHIAIGVKGRAEVTNDLLGTLEIPVELEEFQHLPPTVPIPIVEVKIEQVKSDATPFLRVVSGIRAEGTEVGHKVHSSIDWALGKLKRR